MTTNAFILTQLQHDLAQAFKWMGKATKESQEGDFAGAAYSIQIAMEYWLKCQHTRDRNVDDDTADSLDWKFFTTKALAMAKQELAKED